MEAQAINEWTLNIAMLSILFIFLFVMLLVYRIRINHLCGNNMQCEIVTDEGTGYTKFFPVKDGKLIIEPTRKRMGAEYPVGDLATYLVDYPSLPGAFKILSFVQSKAKKIVLNESTAEPLTNRSNLCLITPQRLYNSDHERFTALATKQSIHEEKRVESQQPKGNKMSWTMIVVMIGIIAVILVGIVVMQNGGLSNAALGLP